MAEKKESAERRMVRLEIDPAILLLMGKGGWKAVSNHFPEGANLIGRCYDADRDVFVLIIEHPSFAAVGPGELIPRILGPQIERIHEPQMQGGDDSDV